jgi:hypothetical protein
LLDVKRGMPSCPLYDVCRLLEGASSGMLALKSKRCACAPRMLGSGGAWSDSVAAGGDGRRMRLGGGAIQPPGEFS